MPYRSSRWEHSVAFLRYNGIMLRRALALWVVLALVTAFFSPPSAPVLVCRMTGEPMPPVAADVENRDSCCAVGFTVGADGKIKYVLTSPGCCDLQLSPDREQPPTVAKAVLDFGPLVAWIPAPPALVIPVTAEVAVTPILCIQTAPRGPPIRTVPARGPPSFS